MSRDDTYLFDKPLSFNMRSSDYKRITKIVRRKYEKFQGSETLFVRCAILKLLREEGA